MAVKTKFSNKEFAEILSNYNLGKYESSNSTSSGTVQSNYILHTTKGKFFFKYYDNRSFESVLFESHLLRYLKDKNFPCSVPLMNNDGELVGVYNEKAYILFEFINGEHIKNSNDYHKKQLIEVIAELHNLTKKYLPVNKEFRWNYSVQLCRELAVKKAENLNNQNAKEKLEWFEDELLKIQLPKALPKGVCHCDLDFTNVLFKGSKLKALIDFDDANYTYFLVDLVCLIEFGAEHNDIYQGVDFESAKIIIDEYEKYRPLSEVEKKHLFDVYKLAILFDGIWFFERGNVEDFFERRKIEYFDNIGREKFYKKLFL